MTEPLNVPARHLCNLCGTHLGQPLPATAPLFPGTCGRCGCTGIVADAEAYGLLPMLAE
jgi:hypothetical protein